MKDKKAAIETLKEWVKKIEDGEINEFIIIGLPSDDLPFEMAAHASPGGFGRVMLGFEIMKNKFCSRLGQDAEYTEKVDG